MTTSRPASASPEDIAAWEEEQQRRREERDFRERASGFFGSATATLQHIKDAQDTHSEEDRRQFAELHRRCDEIESKVGVQNLTISKHSAKFHVLWAAGGLAVTIVTVVWMLVKG